MECSIPLLIYIMKVSLFLATDASILVDQLIPGVPEDRLLLSDLMVVKLDNYSRCSSQTRDMNYELH